MPRLDLSNVKLDKIFVEIRYPDQFKLPDKKFKILEKVTGFFPEYKKDSKPEELLCRKTGALRFLSVYLNRLVVDFDRPIGEELNFSEFKKIASKTIEAIADVLKIETINRIGVRSHWSYEVENLEKAAEIIIGDYFKFEEAEFHMLEHKPDNCQFSFSSKSGFAKYNLIVIPEQEVIIEGQLGATQEHKRNYIKIDWDYYIESSLKQNNLEKIIEEAYLSVGKKVLPFLSKGE